MVPGILHEVRECLPSPRRHALRAVQQNRLLWHGDGFRLKRCIRSITAQLLSLSKLLLGFLELACARTVKSVAGVALRLVPIAGDGRKFGVE